MIQRYIDEHRQQEQRLSNLYDYYKGITAITKRRLADATKPNNKVVSPYAGYITDTFTGYFMGEPVVYQCEKNEELLSRLNELFNYNDEAATDAELAKDASIFGVAYELLYTDENADIRFKKIDATKAIPIFDNTLEEDLLYFIRYYDDTDIMSGKKTTYVEVYSREWIRYYVDEYALKLVREVPHAFKGVPINIYQNNEEELGDFENVISLIDAYDKITSDSVNDMEYFADCYLALYGMSGTEAEDIAAMKEQRVLLMETDAKAEWLTKSINDTYVENLKNRLDAQIHKFSRCPSMTDENFAANASGVAIKYKLMGLENATSKKERAFKKALQRRIELICNIFSVMGSDYDYRDVQMVFTRNIPANLNEMADVVNKIGNLLSKETQISLLPIDVNPEAELKRREEEETIAYDFEGEEDDERLLGEASSGERSQSSEIRGTEPKAATQAL